MNFNSELRQLLRLAKKGTKQGDVSKALIRNKDKRDEAIKYALNRGLVKLIDGESSGGRIPTIVTITHAGQAELDSLVETKSGSIIWSL